MERYLILLVVVSFLAVITAGKDSADRSDVPASYSKIKTSVDVAHEKRICGATSCRNGIQTNIQGWRARANNMSRDTDPQIMYTILPIGESHLLQ